MNVVARRGKRTVAIVLEVEITFVVLEVGHGWLE